MNPDGAPTRPDREALLRALENAAVRASLRARHRCRRSGVVGRAAARLLHRGDAAPLWNLHTAHGPLDVTFAPSGFPHGYDDLHPNARPLLVAGTTITVAVAALVDVEHSKRVADRPKDRDYLERVGRTAPHDATRRP